MLIRHWRTLRTRYLVEDAGRHPDGPPLSVANILALTLVIAILLGVVPALLPGASYQRQLHQPPRQQPPANWQIRHGNCRIDMPHGRKHCTHITAAGNTVRTGGY